MKSGSEKGCNKGSCQHSLTQRKHFIEKMRDMGAEFVRVDDVWVKFPKAETLSTAQVPDTSNFSGKVNMSPDYVHQPAIATPASINDYNNPPFLQRNKEQREWDACKEAMAFRYGEDAKGLELFSIRDGNGERKVTKSEFEEWQRQFDGIPAAQLDESDKAELAKRSVSNEPAVDTMKWFNEPALPRADD